MSTSDLPKNKGQDAVEEAQEPTPTPASEVREVRPVMSDAEYAKMHYRTTLLVSQMTAEEREQIIAKSRDNVARALVPAKSGSIPYKPTRSEIADQAGWRRGRIVVEPPKKVG